ncbi:BUD13 homolog isoform X2 [Monomorium pharaonis]|uniref:BUD13 homolog isoform X2 n=1 Tax=Monomorium pharaonis TaxID=307658 RepID=UPI0017460B82|nr:BUD13 homolog isoform X2 [Monomorium pharaonis]
MENKKISQKEYLRKYIGGGDEKKKKKKKKLKTGAKTVKIIDDDVDLKNMRPIEEGEFDILLEGEDAPQIAGIVDERGPVDFTDKTRWKIITENDEGDLTIVNRTVDKDEEQRNLNQISVKQNNNDNFERSNLSKVKHSKHKRMDLSPHESRDNSSDLSPPRLKQSKNKRTNSDERLKDDSSDLSPPRSKRSKDKRTDSHKRAKNDDSDLSPPRQSKNYDSDLSPSRKLRNYDSDLSPPRKSKNYDSDLSPPRKSKNYDSDLSPPRSTKYRTSGCSTSGRNYRSSGNRDSDSDLSPPRKDRKHNLDTNESRKNTKNRDSDLSTSRRNEYRSQRDHTSPHSTSRRDRGHDYHDKKSSSRSSRQDVSRDKWDKKYDDRDDKSRSHSNTHERRKKTRWNEETDDSERRHTGNSSKDHDGRATKTLDGKTAGFQAAKALREEIEAHKRREAEHFSKLSKEITGEGQAATVRDKTRRKRNSEKEAAEKREQEMKQREINEKYAKWGKGLKQVEDYEEKLKSDLYEMHKPLARYADDEDLNKQFREREREGDPMLEYIKRKQVKEGKRKPDSPQYQGSYAPNRFGIKPGHRWDGVDRSNGYEKKWFEAQNAKVALQEDAYKWSTADM